MIFDSPWRVGYLNAASEQLLGATRQQLLGRDLWMALPELAGTPFHQLHLHARDRNEVVRQECELEEKEVQVRIYPAGPRTVTYVQDISAWREALKREAFDRDSFLAGFACAFYNPLTMLRGSAALLAQRPDDLERVKRTAATVERTASHLQAMLEELLDAVRAASGHLSLVPLEWVDFAALVREQVQLCTDKVGENGVMIRARIPESPVRLAGSQERLAQVLSTLLSLVVCRTKGEVDVSLRLATDEALLEIVHRGSGIDPHHLSRILTSPVDLFAFEFETSHRALAIAKAVVELHGGRLAVEDTGVDAGARLTVRLPLRSPDTAAAVEVPLRILIVTTNSDAGETLADVLELESHQVGLAATSREALDAARRLVPDAALVSIPLGPDDPYALAARLRELPELENVLLLAIYACGETVDAERARAAGFQAALSAPVTPRNLMQQLRAAAPGSRSGAAGGASPVEPPFSPSA